MIHNINLGQKPDGEEFPKSPEPYIVVATYRDQMNRQFGFPLSDSECHFGVRVIEGKPYLLFYWDSRFEKDVNMAEVIRINRPKHWDELAKFELRSRK